MFGRNPWKFAVALSLSLIFVLSSTSPTRADEAFVRGDVDQDGLIDITGPIVTLIYLFLGGVNPDCLDAADANDDGAVNLTDGLFSLTFLLLGGESYPAPDPECGVDTSEDQLGCAESRSPLCSELPAAVSVQSAQLPLRARFL
jgi:hypothetical protein